MQPYFVKLDSLKNTMAMNTMTGYKRCIEKKGKSMREIDQGSFNVVLARGDL